MGWVELTAEGCDGSASISGRPSPYGQVHACGDPAGHIAR